MERAIKKNGQEYRSFIGRKRLFVFALLVFTVLVFLFAIAFGSSTVPLDRVLATLPLPEEEFGLIRSGNARRLLGLAPATED